MKNQMTKCDDEAKGTKKENQCILNIRKTKMRTNAIAITD